MTPEQALANLRLAATKSGTINWWDVEVHASMQMSLQVIGQLVEAAKNNDTKSPMETSVADKRKVRASDLPSSS